MPRHRTHPGCNLGLRTGRLPLEGFISALPYPLLDQHTFPWAGSLALKAKTYRYQERLWASPKRAVVMRTDPPTPAPSAEVNSRTAQWEPTTGLCRQYLG